MLTFWKVLLITSVHQAAKLVAALLWVAMVTAGLAESNGSLPPGLWLTSPAGWLQTTGISSGTLRSVKAKFHYTGPTGPDRTRTDFFARPGPQTRVSDKVRGLRLVGSGRARVVEFIYNRVRAIFTLILLLTVVLVELVTFTLHTDHRSVNGPLFVCWIGWLTAIRWYLNCIYWLHRSVMTAAASCSVNASLQNIS